jgi:GNAT superfamily N-acetyltransferase
MSNVLLASASDVRELVRVINAAYEVEKFFISGDRTDEDTVKRMLTTGVFLVVRSDADPKCLVGCVYVELRGTRGYFGMLSVEPTAQGRGLGRALVEAAERHASAAGCTAMDIRVVDLRLELPAFYRRLGYMESGVTEQAYDPRALRPFQFVTMSKPL